MIYEEGKEDFLEKDVWYCIVPDISFFNDYTALAGDVAVQDWYSDAVETEGTDGLPMQSGDAERESEMEVDTEIETAPDTSTEVQTKRTAPADSNFGLNWKYEVNNSDQI